MRLFALGNYQLEHDTMYSWKELESMLASRRAKAQSAAMTPEARHARALHAVSKRKWRAPKPKDEKGHPIDEEKSEPNPMVQEDVLKRTSDGQIKNDNA